MKISGVNKTLRALRQFGEVAEERIKANVHAAGYNMQHEAMQRVPVDLGELKNSIRLEFSDSGLTTTLIATAPHAPYQEFGTGGEVEVPKEMAELARQFKGSGIKRINLAPQPFLFPAWDIERRAFVDRLQKELTRLARKV